MLQSEIEVTVSNIIQSAVKENGSTSLHTKELKDKIKVATGCTDVIINSSNPFALKVILQNRMKFNEVNVKIALSIAAFIGILSAFII